jgi:hypothetical protein
MVVLISPLMPISLEALQLEANRAAMQLDKEAFLKSFQQEQIKCKVKR